MSLDPTDWADTRQVAHRMVDEMLSYLETVSDRPAWQSVPGDVRDRLSGPVPHTGQPLEQVYESFAQDILPYPTGNIHPRFWGWVMGTGTVTGMLADMLASGMNAHVAGYDQAASLVERQVLCWLTGLMGFPNTASGVLVSGATEANLNALTAARISKAGFDVRADGLLAGPPLAVYGSRETHSWITKACEAMGMGRQGFRAIPVGDDYRIDIAACRDRIEMDLAAGVRPFAVVGNVGTVNTGAIDDLPALRALADEYDLWFHVDGAFGSLAALSAHRHMVAGQELADSMAFDLHKWGYMPYEIGVVLTRDADAQVAAYGRPSGSGPAYLRSSERGIAAGTTYFADRGMQLSRGFRALKVWMSIKEQGVDRIGDAIGRNIDQATRLGELVDAHPDMELLAPVTLNVVCFRYRPAGAAETDLDLLNQEILVQLQLRGIAVPSQTVLDGRYAIRVCITNHRSTDDDFDLLVTSVAQIGAELVAAGNAQRP